MKGFIIFEDFNHFITCKEILDGNYNCVISDYPNGTFSGIINRVTGASCTPKDTYDFETGALIALMKMCLFDKSYKAIEEAFRYNSYNNKKNNEYEKKIDALEKENSHLKYVISCKESAIESLENTRNLLIEKNNNALQIIQEKQDRIIKLKEENKKLKLDCEKLQHGYIDTDMIFCGGRQNGKQHTALVNMFKKLNQKKVDAAYKEAYNTTLPVWQKEVLKQMYGIYETGKWSKPPTKREEMWAEIFELHKESDVIIKVKKEDVNTFLHEIENKIPEITWLSTVKIFETKYTIGDIYEELKTQDMIYFRLWKDNRLSYSSDPHIYPYRELKHIDYLPPIRWDLFKKGRVVVGVRKEHYDEFISNATEHIYRFNKHKPYDNFNYSFFIYDKNANFIEAIGRSQFRQIKEMNNHKVYYWEDVR